jgi:hypothetical protein
MSDKFAEKARVVKTTLVGGLERAKARRGGGAGLVRTVRHLLLLCESSKYETRVDEKNIPRLIVHRPLHSVRSGRDDDDGGDGDDDDDDDDDDEWVDEEEDISVVHILIELYSLHNNNDDDDCLSLKEMIIVFFNTITIVESTQSDLTTGTTNILPTLIDGLGHKQLSMGAALTIANLSKNATRGTRMTIIDSGVIPTLLSGFNSHINSRIALAFISSGDEVAHPLLNAHSASTVAAKFLMDSQTRDDLYAIVLLVNLSGRSSVADDDDDDDDNDIGNDNGNHKNNSNDDKDNDEGDRKCNDLIGQAGVRKTAEVVITVLRAQLPGARELKKNIIIFTTDEFWYCADVPFCIYPLLCLASNRIHCRTLLAIPDLLSALIHGVRHPAMDATNKIRISLILLRLYQSHHRHPSFLNPSLINTDRTIETIVTKFATFDFFQELILIQKARRQLLQFPRSAVSLIGKYLLLLG